MIGSDTRRAVPSVREMRRRLAVRYGRTTDGVRVPEHIVVFEVPIDGRQRFPGLVGLEGVRQRQRIDCLAVGIWRRTDHLVHGFEIKVSRADLLAELRDPSKATAAARSVDRWWLALASPALLRDGDRVPDGWGVIAASGRGLSIVRPADPMPGDRDGRFWAGVMQAGLRSHGACRGLGYVDGVISERRRADRHRGPA